MLPVEEIEKKVRERAQNSLSVAHAFNHLKRTAIGAKWFAELLGGSQEEQEKAYLSGLVHDIHRPPSARLHDESLLEDYKQAKDILELFELPEKVIEEITLPIKKHREKFEGEGILYQSVFLADKILENMGAMIVFRRNMYLGENPDYENVPLPEATKRQYERRLKKFSPKDFPERFLRLAEYQYKWPVAYFEAFKNREEWALHLSEYCYQAGKKRKEFEQSVKEFKPEFEKGKEYKEESLQYIKGEKFKFFESLIK